MNEIRIFGPPGTGKTTALVQHIKEAVAKVGSSNVIVSSFSKAAAQELVGRDVPVDRSNVGTLHAICYRALGSPEIAELHVEDFNQRYPQFRVPEQKKSAIDTPEMIESGDTNLLQQYNLMRARGAETCRALLNPDTRGAVSGVSTRAMVNFITAWGGWKKDNDLSDFTDMLYRASTELETCPGNPNIGFFDEVQDFNPLMMEVVRKWISHMDYAILAGDDDQTIYTFMGASPATFLQERNERGSVTERVLSRSYRLPIKVKEWAETWIKRVSRRKEKDFSATSIEGEVNHLWRKQDITWRTPEKLIPSIQKDISDGMTVMLLSSCSYMMTPLISCLRANGIPYSNRYRPSNGSWNPFPQASEKRTPAYSRLLSFLNPICGINGAEHWTVQDFKSWRNDISAKAEGLRTGILKHSMTGIHGLQTLETGAIFEDSNETPPFCGDVGGAMMWFMDNLVPSKRKSYEFAYSCVMEGNAAFMEEPAVTVGTIHSVKGGESDSVYLFPDLSASGARHYYSGDSEQRDIATRLFYVGATRARYRLNLVGGHNYNQSVRWQ